MSSEREIKQKWYLVRIENVLWNCYICFRCGTKVIFWQIHMLSLWMMSISGFVMHQGITAREKNCTGSQVVLIWHILENLKKTSSGRIHNFPVLFAQFTSLMSSLQKYSIKLTPPPLLHILYIECSWNILIFYNIILCGFYTCVSSKMLALLYA